MRGAATISEDPHFQSRPLMNLPLIANGTATVQSSCVKPSRGVSISISVPLRLKATRSHELLAPDGPQEGCVSE